MTVAEQATLLLIAHQRHRGACLCGWAVLGASYAEHVVSVLVDAGILAPEKPDADGPGQPGKNPGEHGGLVGRAGSDSPGSPAAPPDPLRDAIEAPHGTPVVHACPPNGSGVMPCCGRTPFEIPSTDRMTVRDEVTCGTTTGGVS